VRDKLEQILQEAAMKFDDTYREVAGCFDDINQGL
jgi:hypothetical protein